MRFESNLVWAALIASHCATGAEALRLEEMLVTSERYRSPLLEVPVSVHVVTGEHIEKAGITTLSELSVSVPNLMIGDGAINTNIYMRGVGSGTNRAFEQSVGMFIDEVYMGRGSQYRTPFLDLQQVEVLRGPQGALFGKNTIAGAVVLTTRKPELEEDFNASLAIDVEPEYDGRSATAIVSGAINDQWAARLVNKTSRHDGYWENTFNGNDEVAKEESTTRLSVLYKPTDSWQFTTKLERSDTEFTGSAVQLRVLEPLTPLSAILQAQMYLADPKLETELNDKKSVDHRGLSDSRKQTTDNAVFAAYFDGADVDVSYTVGYSDFHVNESQDLDYSPLEFIDVDDEREFTQWSQELRFDHQLTDTSRLQWGGYWQQQDLDVNYQENLALPPPLALWDVTFLSVGLDPSVIPPTPLTRNTRFQQESNSWAVFAEWDWTFTDDWRLLFGGRFNRENKKYQRVSSEDAYLQPGIPVSFSAAVTAQVLGVNVLTPRYEKNRVEEDFLPSAKLWWDMAESTNAYVKVERGAKSGGFNAVADAAPSDQEYDDEQAINYEIGSKSLFFDDRIALNASIFYTEIDDLQVTVLNGTRFLVGNAAESVSQGVELDGRWRINENWNLSAYSAYLDAYYKSYSDGPCTAKKSVAGMTECDLSGETVLFAPELSAGLQLDYEYSLNASVDMIAGLGINYSDDYSVNADLDPIDRQPSYTKYDAQLGLRSEHWELFLIGKNLSDETIVNYGVDTPLIPGGHAAYLAAPRTYMLQMKVMM